MYNFLFHNNFFWLYKRSLFFNFFWLEEYNRVVMVTVFEKRDPLCKGEAYVNISDMRTICT
jgi:hypothetical protein